ncbi:hypothetical protein [Malaciobacter mytili]|uniref:Periplasmic protein n=1 Tax=Malaciobacter mytili LMG 24559 TaxID=1032238 RepID=A0AAX2AJK5_9BACT|nr:hypothetical protein [Malaciobacter mytili]AXH16179.1 hypothetical protein AMYT_2647 [Malaciobacter mytili LMG 24559]RXI40267.1 hypothetical protein CRU99_10380 [Malaciobacter mytili]RXK17078.1 hypothetical protein CP985_00270 [Malaciobacter mytili LMG 24559]
MLFLVFFGFIAFIFIALNMYDNSNLKELEEYIKTQNCKNYIYSKGSYKAICENRVLEMKNSLVIDLQKNKAEYFFKDINKIEKQKNSIIFNDKKLDFNSKEDMEIFYKFLQEKLQNERNN